MRTRQYIVQMMTVVTVLGVLGWGLAHAVKLEVDIGDSNCSDIIGDPYCTIQEAVNAASPGDRIDVEPGTYLENVTIPSGKDSINLDASPATIDCAGSGTGITVLGDGNIVEDFKIVNCDIGIDIGDVTEMVVSGEGNLVEDNKLDTNTIGIRVSGEGNLIEDNRVTNSYSHGIEVIGGKLHVVEENKMTGNTGWGFVIRSETSDNVVQNNEAVDNGSGGYWIDGRSETDEDVRSNRNLLFDNEAEENGGDGFRLEEGRRTQLLENDAVGNKGNGFNLIGDARRNKLVENWAEENEGHGFSLTVFDGDMRPGARDALLVDNTAVRNWGDGYHLEGESRRDHDVLIRNLAEANGGDGFNTDAAINGGSYVENVANSNTGFGMRDDSPAPFPSTGGTYGTRNVYTDNKCASNGAGDSNKAGLCN